MNCLYTEIFSVVPMLLCLYSPKIFLNQYDMLNAGRLRVRFGMRSWEFSIYLIRPAHYGPGVDLASNRNDYQESSLGLKGGRRVRLTT
jgi:hypothetical protein